MKQEEKTKRTCDRILSAAIAEFGSKSYENGSLNSICSDHKISKGLIYHNFKNKDELYLSCVKVCFEELTDFLRSAEWESKDIKETIQNLLTLRQRFFLENPYYRNLFYQTILQPPKHLWKELQEMRHEFDEFHASRYRELLSYIELREGITEEEAMEYFFAFQEMFNEHFQGLACGNADVTGLMENHESRISGMLNVMLYGIAKEKK